MKRSQSITSHFQNGQQNLPGRGPYGQNMFNGNHNHNIFYQNVMANNNNNNNNNQKVHSQTKNNRLNNINYQQSDPSYVIHQYPQNIIPNNYHHANHIEEMARRQTISSFQNIMNSNNQMHTKQHNIMNFSQKDLNNAKKSYEEKKKTKNLNLAPLSEVQSQSKNGLSPVYEKLPELNNNIENNTNTERLQTIIESQSVKKLTDLIDTESECDRTEFYKNVVVAIDQLYPESKWPLHDTWTFSYIKHDNSIKNWSDRIITVMDISFVEDFWSAANYLLNNPSLTANGDLTFFKKGIKPEWEDDQNRTGGCWLYHMNHHHQQNTQIEELWQETLLGLIGDNFCDQNLIENEHICDSISGTILMHRGKNEKISLWTKDYKNDTTTRLIGKIWKNLIKLNDSVTISFEAHETKNSKNPSVRIAYKE